jgi:autotransporter-associated beta strand protein
MSGRKKQAFLDKIGTAQSKRLVKTVEMSYHAVGKELVSTSATQSRPPALSTPQMQFKRLFSSRSTDDKGRSCQRRSSFSSKRHRERRLCVEPLETRNLLTATWTKLANSPPVGTGTMDLLTNGSVLMAAGSNQWAILTPTASGSYINGTWTTISDADYTRLYDSTQVLQNGNVFVAGGEYGNGTATGEVYDPATNVWIQLPSQPYGNFVDSVSMLLANGNVLIAPVSPSQSGYTTIFNTSTNTWSQGPKLYRGGDADEQGWVKLPDGSILTIDGASTSERYIPAQNAWINDGAVPEDLFDSLGEIGPGVLLNNGQVIYFGATSTSVIYTPSGTTSPGTWTAGPAIPNGDGCDDAAAAVLRDGTVLVATGPTGTYNGPTTFYIYNPTTNSFSAAPNAPSDSGPSFVSRMLALPDGNVLVLVNGTIYEFNPGTAISATAAADAPSITSITGNANGSFLLTGTGLNGINAGAAYGDDCQMDSNYPIVEFVNGSNVYYATSYNWSNTGVMLGGTSETVDFTLPLGIPAGTYSVYAVANGIASSATSLTIPTTTGDTGPTVQTAAAASASTVTGTTVNLSVLGSDSAGASSLTYTWSTSTSSNSVQLPSFSDNGDNAAQGVTVTFQQAGTYTFKATITDAVGLSTTSSVTVTVAQTYTSAGISPALASLGGGGTKQFTATAYDQFDNAMSSQPTFTWSITSGTGSISNKGLYTSTTSGTLATIMAKSGAYSATAQAGVVSKPWTSSDIGSVGVTGTAYDNGTTFTVEGSGGDIWGTSDEFHFVYQTLSGDGVILARVDTLTNTGGWAKVGVMIRNSLSANDQYALEAITPSNGSTFQYRTTSGGSAAGTGGDSGPAVPYWVKLVRSGNTLTGYRSVDGNTWVSDGTISITMGTTVYVGLEVDANNNSALNTSTFDQVALLAGGNSAPVVTQAATAAASTVTGTTVGLSALASDSNGANYLNYTWAATSIPSGATAPTFSVNNTSAAYNTTATFSAAGSYTFQVTVTNEYGLSVTSSVVVTVVQTPTGIGVGPAATLLLPSATCQLSTFNADQFGNPISGNISAAWSLTSGTGTLTAQGLYTAPSSGTTATITATSGNYTASASMQVVQATDYWAFNAGSGTTAVDSGSGGHNGTLVGSPTWTSGEAGGALTLNGSSQYVNASLSLNSNTVTMSAWIYRNGNESSYAGLIFDRNASSPTGMNFYSTTNELGYTWNNSASTYNWNSGLTVPNQQWTFVALVVTATNATMYMEPAGGALQSATNTVANPAVSFSGTTCIGQDSTGGRLFAGTIGDVRIYNASLTTADIAALADVAPTVATAAAASPSNVTASTTALSAAGAYVSGASNLTYTWRATSLPTGAAQPTFSANGSNAAQNTTATFTSAGNYTLAVTITDPLGLYATSTVRVTVAQTATSIVVTPATANLGSQATQPFLATVYDQFGHPLSVQPGLTWSVATGAGSISAGGLYTAPYASGTATVDATSGGITSNIAAVTVTDAAPTVATPAAAMVSSTGTTAALSVLGADSDGGGEPNLSYTWSSTGPASVIFSANGSNAAKLSTATFTMAGSYTVTATITDLGGMCITSSVNVSVGQVVTSIAVSPAAASLGSDQAQQFAAAAYDQFGTAMSSQPGFTWSVASGGGSISAGGLYMAPYATGAATVEAASGGITSNIAAVTVTDAAPTVATAAATSPNTATAESISVSVLGADSDGGGEPNLSYTWSATGPADVSFSGNGSNAAKVSTATFTAAGSYTLTATITDMGGMSTTSSVNVSVAQTLTSIAVTPASASLGSDQTQQFSATAYDQFGAAMSSQPGFTWSVASGGGSISTGGLYMASYASGAATVSAASGGITSNIAAVTVTDAAPTVATAAAATVSATGTTAALSVLGADSDGGGEPNLSYTWSATGPGDVSFSANGSNAAKLSTATFTAAGSYTLTATITDMGGMSTTSSVNVSVAQTLTSIALTPASASLGSDQTQQFSATAYDQFGATMASPPGFMWSVTSGAGSISAGGLYTASYASGAATVDAASGGITSNIAAVTVTDAAPTVATAAAATLSATGTTASLSVLGDDSDGGGEPNLSYTWSSTGPASVAFSANSSNAAKLSTATFTAAGSYTLTATITDMGGMSTTSSVNVSVAQTLTSIAVTPASASLGSDQTQQFSATAYDQFGAAMASQPDFTWSVASGAGSISAAGLYTSSYASGAATVNAASGGITSNIAAVTVTDAAPTVATAAAATLSATGTTAALSVLGDDSDGGGEPNLSYAWSATGPADVSFSGNGSNAAKFSTATFTAAGSYMLTATITDLGGMSTTSSVNVTVAQVLSSLAVSPASVTLNAGASQQFAVTAIDQFGAALTTPPTVSWSMTGGGSLSSSGLYQAPEAESLATISAASGAFVSTASVSVPGQPEWSATADGSWGGAGNWQDSSSAASISAPGLRSLAGSTVLFSSSIGNTVTLDGDSPGLAAMTFNSGPTGFTVAPGSGGTLHLDNGSSPASLVVAAGKQTISAPLSLDSSVVVSPADGSQLSITGGISGSGSSLTLQGGGRLILGGANSYTGGTIVAAGTLVVSSAGALPGGSLLVGAGAGLLFSGGSNSSTEAGNVVAATATAANVAGEPTVAAAVAAPAPRALAAAPQLATTAAPTLHDRALLAAFTPAADRAPAWPPVAATWQSSTGSTGQDDLTRTVRDMILTEWASQNGSID